MMETSDLIEKIGDGSSPSEAHCGGWEGLGKERIRSRVEKRCFLFSLINGLNLLNLRHFLLYKAGDPMG